MRSRCNNCLKLIEACFCKFVKPIHNHKKIIVLQTKEESRHILNTGVMAKLTFDNISLFIDDSFQNNSKLKELINSSKACLFKPHENALSFETSHEEFDTLIFIDATWKKANRIYFENDFLHELPMVSFSTKMESQYFLRKEPKKNFISTFEATIRAVEIDQNQSFHDSLTPLREIQNHQKSFI